MKTIKVADKLLSLNKEIHDLEAKIRANKDEMKEEISKIGDIVEELATYIKLNNYPTDIYPIFSSDNGEYDSYKDVELKIVYRWGYTDVVGLSTKEFQELNKILNTINND